MLCHSVPRYLLLASAISFSTTDEANLSEFVNAGFVVFALTLKCGLLPGCLDSFFNAYELINQLGSMGMNTMIWTADVLQQVFLSTYPHVNRPVSPATLVLSLALSNTPVFGDLYDLYTGVSGYDPITGQYLAGWERLANIAGAIPIFGISGANIRHGMHSAEFFVGQGDEVAQFIGATCSFDEETPVSTKDGPVAIREIDVGDQVLAWDENTGTTGYYTVTATTAHVDPVIVHLTINGETITTTPEHPFYERETAPWLAVGEAEGRWTPAGELKAGDQIQQADSTTGIVKAVVFEATEQLMYNLTVANAHTYVVGDGEWVVHNGCGIASARDFILTHGISGDGATRKVVRLAQEMQANGFQNIPSVSVVIHDSKLLLVDGHHRVAAARLARIDVPYEAVDEAWLAANTGWSSIAEAVTDSMKFNVFQLTERILKKAGYR